MSEYTIEDDVSSNDPIWREWTQMVENEYWLADDRSVTTLTPFEHTTRCVAAKDKDGGLIGIVIWNEYDNLAWLGFYILRENYRGKGIGSVIWDRAMHRIRKTGYILGLRGVPAMSHKYQAHDTPHKRDMMGNHKGRWDSFVKFAKKHAKTDLKQWASSTLNENQLEKVYAFDLKVTGKDRKDFLKKFLSLPFTYASFIENEKNEIIAMAFITTTGPPNEHYFKVGPIYASTVAEAMSVSLPVFEHAGQQFEDAKLLVNIVDSIGRDELEPLLVQEEDINSDPDAQTSLYSIPMNETFRRDLVFAPNNNSIHYDA
ncbi:unnamed protein product [Auanema sp. JU1783]|nr:unnamed protein product [Auanema sp. JU1783]